jgi:hypothetical protein
MNNPNFAIRFDETPDMGLGECNKAYPFIYNFVHNEDDNWDTVKGAGTLANLTGIGPNIAPGATIDWNVRMDPDYTYKVKFLRYTVYWYNSQGTPQYGWYDPIVGWDYFPDFQTHIGTPLRDYIDISLSTLGPNSNYIYGGDNIDRFMNGGGNLQPVNVPTLQGYDYGMGQLNTPFLIPKEGLLRFKITNRHTIKTLTIGGMVYGFKIRM